ncbi:GNAT family N-acetyltransferase [Rhizobium leguminosarum]|uniref:GNAT family N-acetyltransferase n=1 Tax=Rhizobium leguminosarum TaxID=384 RepID=UPI000365DAF0|nr:GNAT family N-acetyltransferase [Rhizobium leguminosarum]
MSISANLKINLSHSQEAKARAAVALYRYNTKATGIDDRAPIGAELYDPAGKVLGGLWGRTELGLLFLDMFFLPHRLRGSGYGARLLAVVEEDHRAFVETSSFQAPGFYVHRGYQEFGRIEFGVAAHARIFLSKHL